MNCIPVIETLYCLIAIQEAKQPGRSDSFFTVRPMSCHVFFSTPITEIHYFHSTFQTTVSSLNLFDVLDVDETDI